MPETGERRGGGVDPEVPRVGSLEVVRGALLNPDHALAVPLDASRRGPARKHPGPASVEEPPAIQPAQEGGVVELVPQPHPVPGAHRGGAQEPDPDPTIRGHPLRPQRPVVGGRLDLRPPARVAGRQPGHHAVGDGVQRAEAPGGRQVAAQLRGGQDAGGGGDVLVVGVGHLGLRLPADAAAVEEQRVLPTIVPIVAGALLAELEHRRPIHEEGTLLLEERLDVGQVDGVGIDLDLAEIGVEGRVEAHAASQPGMQIRATIATQPRAVVERVERGVLQVFALGRQVGPDFEGPRRRDTVLAH